MNKYVLDTSVVIKWFSEYAEDDLDKALGIRDNILGAEHSAIIPDLVFYELANALRYNSRFNEKDVIDAVNSVFDIGLDVKAIEPAIMRHAVKIAYKYNVTVYDSFFLALAQVENIPFITADYKFCKRLRHFKNIVKLSDI